MQHVAIGYNSIQRLNVSGIPRVNGETLQEQINFVRRKCHVNHRLIDCLRY
jgi:hypothetical protein